MTHTERMSDKPHGPAILPKCPTRKVGNSVYISVPGRVPVIKSKRRPA